MSLKRGLAVLCIAAMALGPLGCVDVPSTGPQLPDYRSVYRFVYAANDANPGQLLVDGASKGNLNVAQATGYLDLPAGSRLLEIAGSAGKDTVFKSFDTDRRGSVIVLTKGAAAGSVRSYLVLNERFSYESLGAAVPTDTALVRFANGLSDGTATQAIGIRRRTTGSAGQDSLITVVSNVAFGAASAYFKFPAGNHALVVTKANSTDSLAAATINATSKSRHLGVIFGTSATAATFGGFQEQ